MAMFEGMLLSAGIAVVAGVGILAIRRAGPVVEPPQVRVSAGTKLTRAFVAIILIVIGLIVSMIGSLFAWAGGPAVTVYGWLFGGFGLVVLVIAAAVTWGMRKSATPWFMAYGWGIALLFALLAIGALRK